MSKIICDVCGTSFPDTSVQCPICGSVRPADPTTDTSVENASQNSGYQYVKGGRFSNSNVKKRNKAKKSVARQEEDRDDEGKRSGGLIALLIILLIIIACLLIFVVMAATGNLPIGTPSQPTPGTVTDPPEPVSVECTQIVCDYDQINLNDVGATFPLKVSVKPVNTTDTLSFTSSDPSVATVDENGVITYVAPGNATITIQCGLITAECQIICEETVIVIPPEDFRLTRNAIEFEMEGFSWILYSGEIPMEQITWSSDDETVAKIENGVVFAVGEGQTTVYGEYLGNKVGCEITCDFSTEGEGETEGGNEGSSEIGELHIYAVYFFNPNNYDDFSINIAKDDTLTLMLCDKDKNQVEASWSINAQPYATISGSKVKGLIPGGTAIVTATYNGKQYTCTIRLN